MGINVSDSTNRTPIDWLRLFFTGLAMGAADVVPGVSGGTIAFVAGIYQELLRAIGNINLRAIKTLFSEGPVAAWQAINGNFLLVLFSGILLSILSLAKLVTHLLHHHPILIWSFFFGLIAASIVYIFRQITVLQWPQWLALLVGTLVAVVIANMPPLRGTESHVAVFLAGSVAICAMILPGVSGSFILLLLGMYPIIIGAIGRLQVDILLVFAAGCGVGLLLFSRLLSWLLQRHYSTTMALLNGFLMGSLMIVWPWREVLEVFVDNYGREVVLSSRTILPGEYAAITGLDPQTLWAIGCMLAGAVVVFGLEFWGAQKRLTVQ